MAIIDHFKEIDRRVLTQSWSTAERQSLLCIVREIHRSDGVYSPEERAGYDRLTADLGVSDGSCTTVEEAVAALSGDGRKMSLVYIWMAEAVLADGCYNEREQDFLDGLCAKYALSRPALERTIRELQLREIDEVMRKWIEDTYWDPTSAQSSGQSSLD